MSANPQEKAAAEPGGMEFQGLMLTDRAYAAIKDRDDLSFELQGEDDQIFPFYRVISKN